MTFQQRCVAKSGSGHTGSSNISQLLDDIEYEFADDFLGYDIVNNSKLFVDVDCDLDKEIIESQGRRFKFAEKEYHHYEMRKLSDTNNPNVIFSIELYSTDAALTDDEFIDILEYGL